MTPLLEISPGTLEIHTILIQMVTLEDFTGSYKMLRAAGKSPHP